MTPEEEDELAAAKAHLASVEGALRVALAQIQRTRERELEGRLKLDAHLQHCRELLEATELPAAERAALVALLDTIVQKVRARDQAEFERSWGE